MSNNHAFNHMACLYHAATLEDFLPVVPDDIKADYDPDALYLPFEMFGLDEDSSYLYALDAQGTLLTTLAFQHENGNVMSIAGLYVDPDYQGQQIGSLMLNAMMSHAEAHKSDLFLGVFTTEGWNAFASRIPDFHKNYPDLRMGFDVLNERQNGMLVDGRTSYKLVGKPADYTIAF